MQITNQKPCDLSPSYILSAATDPYDPTEAVKQTIIEPLFEPLIANTSVQIVDDNGKTLDEDAVTQLACNCMGDDIDPVAETDMDELLNQTLMHYSVTMPNRFQELWLNQAASRANLPWPNTITAIYTINGDIISPAQNFLLDASNTMTNQTHADESIIDTLFCGIGFVFHPKTLGFYFLNAQAYEDFKNWAAMQVNALKSQLAPNVVQLFDDFDKTKLDGLVEGVSLRTEDNDNDAPLSFTRLLVSLLMSYTVATGRETFGVLPFDMSELCYPHTVTFVNIDAHAHATVSTVKKEWNAINNALSMPVRPVSTKKIASLKAAGRAAQRAVAKSIMAGKPKNDLFQTARVRFRKSNLTAMDITKLVMTVSKKMAQVAKSENSYKSVKMSYARPNRRDPDNFNLQGKVVSTKYRPDLHIYIDTSGSISEPNYECAIKACIRMARKMNVNLYFTSFSHVISQTTLLHTRDKTAAGCYREFQRVPKVTGGTDFSLVWDYINQSKKRQRELSLMLTDFEYPVPNKHIKHPKNLYYLPIANTDWKWIVHCAEQFCKSMMLNDPLIRNKMLF